MKRNIVYIDKDKCNGCGVCVNTCHEGAIGLVDGKAQLLSDEYCDGLGNCLRCPQDAISIIEREADEYDIKKAPKRINPSPTKQGHLGGCPGSVERQIDGPILQNWPVQLQLAPTKATYFDKAHLLIAADCTAFAYPNIHQDFIADRVTLIACPKLDDNNYYTEKMTEILKTNNIKSMTVLRMEVPCCGGITSFVKRAMLDAEINIPYNEVTISLTGEIK